MTLCREYHRLQNLRTAKAAERRGGKVFTGTRTQQSNHVSQEKQRDSSVLRWSWGFDPRNSATLRFGLRMFTFESASGHGQSTFIGQILQQFAIVEFPTKPAEFAILMKSNQNCVHHKKSFQGRSGSFHRGFFSRLKFLQEESQRRLELFHGFKGCWSCLLGDDFGAKVLAQEKRYQKKGWFIVVAVLIQLWSCRDGL